MNAMVPLTTADIDEHALLGSGWAHPVSGNARGDDIALASDEQDIQQSIRIILSTSKNERVMRNDWGGNLNALLFEPMSTTTLMLAKHYVEQALTQWEPRINLQNVTVEPDTSQPGKLGI